LRQIAHLDLTSGAPRARVALEVPAPGDPLGELPDEHNAAVIELGGGRRVVARGRGAGSRPTAEAVLADVLELARSGAAVADELEVSRVG
jgi:homoserine dehydrogenase